MTAMRFIGLDLAWSMRKTQRPDTGAVVLDESGQVLANAHLTTDVEILAYVLAHSGADGGIVGIDAPLVVPNDTGRRACEAQLHAVGISSYPANRSNFARAYGGVRGELLMMRLSAEGFALATEMAPGMPRRACLEVYPRAFIQRTWGAVPPYKGAGPPTTLLYGLRALQQHLLTDLDPPVRWHEPPVPLDGWPHLARRELKCWGDLLDAALSAYTVYLAWRRGPLAMEVFGDLERGFIVAPRAGWRASVAASTATHALLGR